MPSRGAVGAWGSKLHAAHSWEAQQVRFLDRSEAPDTDRQVTAPLLTARPTTDLTPVRSRDMLPRPVLPGATYLLTRRCIERRFLLRPSRQTNQIIEYCLAVASARTGVEAHAFCAMSNHVHAVVTDVHGRLPEFLQLFHRHVAVALNASLGRKENVWAAHQTSVVELDD